LDNRCTGMPTALFDNSRNAQIGTSDTDLPANAYVGLLDDVRVYNRALSSQEIAQLYNLGTTNIGHSNTTSYANGLVGYWPLDGHTTSWKTDTTQDISGNGNTGTMVGMSTTTSTVAGKIGSAMQCSGLNYITAPSSPSLEITTNVSVFAWVKPSATQSNGTPTIVSKNATVANYQLGLDTTTGVTLVRPCVASGCWVSTNSIPTNKWSHIGLTYDGSFVRIYINGILDSKNVLTGSLPTNSGDVLTIGTDSVHNYPFTGPIDDVRVYNRALSAQEVYQLYHAGK
jgi:hypothetical protein